MTNQCKKLNQFQPSLIHPKMCACHMPGNGACLNPVLKDKLPTARTHDQAIPVCPTKGVRP
jgi:hypothetical protein